MKVRLVLDMSQSTNTIVQNLALEQAPVVGDTIHVENATEGYVKIYEVTKRRFVSGTPRKNDERVLLEVKESELLDYNKNYWSD